MSNHKSKKHASELTKPDMAKVNKKISNTAKHAAQHEKCIHAQANLARLQAKYPQVQING